MENLTFNYGELLEEEAFKAFDDNKLAQYLSKIPDYRHHFLKKNEFEEVMESAIISASELREFIENTFGIDMKYPSSGRNRLNEILNEMFETKRGKETKLTLYQYKKLLLNEKFERFILNNYWESKAENIDKLYQELGFLQLNKFKYSREYKKMQDETINIIAKFLNEVDRYYKAAPKSEDINDIQSAIKGLYGFPFFVKEQFVISPLSSSIREQFINNVLKREGAVLVDVVSSREGNPEIIQFENESQVWALDGLSMIRIFLQDIMRWYDNTEFDSDSK